MNKRILAMVILLTSIFLACDKTDSTQNARLAQEWQALDFSDWTPMTEGILSPNEFQNFILEGEFFLAEGQQNQILIRSAKGADQAFSEGAYYINLDHNPDQQNPMGSIVGRARAMLISDLSTKAWNKIAISALGQSIEVRINGQKVVATHDSQFSSGFIGFKASQELVGMEEQFRNFRIKVLETEFPAQSNEIAAIRAAAQAKAQSILGDNMDGWHGSGTSAWSLDAGVLTGESGPEGGCLISDSLYKNCYLNTQFKIAKEDNSGIFIRLHPDSSNISPATGIECNIYDHNGFTHAFSTGSIVTHARAFSHLIDYDAWNQLEILAVDNEVVLYINGQKSADHVFPAGQFADPGLIALQAGIRVFSDQGPSKIQFKEIRLAVLD